MAKTIQAIQFQLNKHLQGIHEKIKTFGKARHTSMLIVVTTPKTQDDKTLAASIGFAGSSSALAQALKSRFRSDPNFKKFMQAAISESKLFDDDPKIPIEKTNTDTFQNKDYTEDDLPFPW